MAGFDEFSKRLKKTGQRIVENADKAVRRTALAIDSAVVYSTPVDTGRARSNWQVGIDGPVEGTIEPLRGVSKGHKSTGTAVAQTSIENAKAVIATYKGGTPTAAIHITNNLPYIGRLNEGWSAQAPAGFVETAVREGIAHLKNMKIVSETRE